MMMCEPNDRHWKHWLMLAALLALVLALTACGGRDRAEVSLRNIEAAAQAQQLGANVPLTAAAIRGHAITGLLNLGAEPDEEDLEWLRQILKE